MSSAGKSQRSARGLAHMLAVAGAAFMALSGCTVHVYRDGRAPMEDERKSDSGVPIYTGRTVSARQDQRSSLQSDARRPDASGAPQSLQTQGQREPKYRIPTPRNKKRLTYSGRTDGAFNRTAAQSDITDTELQLNFSNTPVADAARAIINETLGRALSIADGVEGTVTLTSPEPVPGSVALRALEDVLAESGLALVEIPTGYLLTTLDAAAERAQPIARGREAGLGYGVTIETIMNAAPSEVARLIQPYISQRLAVTADDENSVLFLRGPQSDVRAALDAVALFDAPWLADRVFGLFELQYAKAEPLKTEIDALFDAGGAQAGGVEVIGLPRLNALFVAARDDALFRETQGWIRRLDKPAGGPKQRLFYYAAEHLPAETLAESLSAIFTENTQGSGGGEEETVAASSAEATIVADEANNALIIRATNEQYEEILEIIERMDKVAPQVLVEASIVEVILTDDLSYGVQWFLSEGDSTFAFSNAEDGAVASTFPGASYTYLTTDFRVALNALASVTDVTVLSTPSVVAQNNQTASLQVGDEVPIVTQTSQAIVDTNAPIVSNVQLRDTGVILEVKPRINSGNTVVLEISQEVSDVAETTTSGIDSPTIQQRRFSSTIAVEDGKTIALGGLIRESDTFNESKVPLLGDAPLIKNLFRSRGFRKRRTELIVFLTPRILRNGEDAEAALRELSGKMQELKKRIEEKALL
ncbi:MAG: type II secretion system secretin GspD [Pseudomonadota bacterium]